jgi:hypothetical protein
MKSDLIELPSGDKRFLEGFRGKGQHSARETTRAHILLALESGVVIGKNSIPGLGAGESGLILGGEGLSIAVVDNSLEVA